MGWVTADDAQHDAARGARRSSRRVYNTGHGHLGWTLSAATATMLVELLREDRINRAASVAAVPVSQ
jgi:glycine/D-amino acid oxidase-like deaminating enzyme